MPAWSRAGRLILRQGNVVGGCQGKSGTPPGAGTPGTPAPQTSRARCRSPRPPAALLCRAGSSSLGLLGCEPGGEDRPGCSRGQVQLPNPSPEPGSCSGSAPADAPLPRPQSQAPAGHIPESAMGMGESWVWFWGAGTQSRMCP